VEFVKWRVVVDCYSPAAAHLLIAAIHSHRVLSWQALAFGVFSRARCGETTPPSLGRSVSTSDLNRSDPDAAASVFVHRGLASYLRRYGMALCSPRGVQKALERQLCLAAGLKCSQDASPAAAWYVPSGSEGADEAAKKHVLGELRGGG
jgi:hypothetical protein